MGLTGGWNPVDGAADPRACFSAACVARAVPRLPLAVAVRAGGLLPAAGGARFPLLASAAGTGGILATGTAGGLCTGSAAGTGGGLSPECPRLSSPGSSVSPAPSGAPVSVSSGKFERSDSAGLALLTYSRNSVHVMWFGTHKLTCNLIHPYLPEDGLGLSRVGCCLHIVDSGPCGGCRNNHTTCTDCGCPTNTPSKTDWDWCVSSMAPPCCSSAHQ